MGRPPMLKPANYSLQALAEDAQRQPGGTAAQFQSKSSLQDRIRRFEAQ